MSWYSCKTFHECTQVCTYRLLSSSISARYQALVTQAECQQEYSSPCSPVLTSECSSTRSLRACILQAPLIFVVFVSVCYCCKYCGDTSERKIVQDESSEFTQVIVLPLSLVCLSLSVSTMCMSTCLSVCLSVCLSISHSLHLQ